MPPRSHNTTQAFLDFMDERVMAKIGWNLQRPLGIRQGPLAQGKSKRETIMGIQRLLMSV
jgi:hypothetical protein